MQVIHLGSIDLGDGVLATEAWLSDSPFVLVQTRTGDRQLKSRLDLQKRMFIDPLPGTRTEAGLTELVVSVQEQLAA